MVMPPPPPPYGHNGPVLATDGCLVWGGGESDSPLLPRPLTPRPLDELMVVESTVDCLTKYAGLVSGGPF